MEKPKILCESPNPGEEGTEIEKWKYHVIRRVIVRVLEDNPAGVYAHILPDKVQQIISDPQTRSNIGFIPWYTDVVKLDLHAKQEITVTLKEDGEWLKLKN